MSPLLHPAQTAGWIAVAAFPSLLIAGHLPDDLTARLIVGSWLGVVACVRLAWWASGEIDRVLEMDEDLGGRVLRIDEGRRWVR